MKCACQRCGKKYEAPVQGRHRVVCGDSQKPEPFAALDIASADMIWTDPPYGVDYGAKNRYLQDQVGLASRHTEDIEGDGADRDQLLELLRTSFKEAIGHCRAGAVVFVTGPTGDMALAFAMALDELGLWRQMLIWRKHRPIFGRSDYHYAHEAIFYGWVPGAAHTPPPDHSFDSVWEINAPTKSDLHPTMKPVALIERSIANHTSEGDLVLDVFGGSGSTMVAAHLQGRRSALVEKKAEYVDVICKRWIVLTGRGVFRAGTEQPFPVPSG